VKGSVTYLLFFMFAAFATYSQTGQSLKPQDHPFNPSYAGPAAEDPENGYEEISITLHVPRIGSLEIPVIIHEQTVYLSVTALFDFLRIRNRPSEKFDQVTGFFIHPQATYTIDKSQNNIVYQDKVFPLHPNDLIQTPTAFYLKSAYFGQVFGLACVFNFRDLAVTLHTKVELPAIREMQMDMMRRNINQLRGEKKADTMIRRSFPLFHLGTADWSVVSTQETKGRSNTRANLGIGAMIAGGEVNLSLNYNSHVPLNLRQQFYQWRFVNNEHAALRQVVAGKIFAQSTASIFAPVAGFQLTNTPTTYRKSFGTYTLSNTTEPGWMVELYVNNVLVDYVKADASGFYTFEVPMVYGNSIVKLRFYGPWGEERTSEKFINIPFNFIQLHQFEYNITAGIVDDAQKSKFSRASFNYGLGRRITVGGGMEYLSSVTSGKYMPYINASFGLGQHILVSGEHTYGVGSKGVITYRRPSNLQVDLNYTRYHKDQTAVVFNYQDEKKLVLSMPFRGKKFTAFSRFTLNQFTLPYNKVIQSKTKYTAAEFLFSSVIAGVSSNLTTYAILGNPGNPLVYSNLSLNFRFPARIRVTPQAQYEYRRKNFSMVKLEAEKNIFNRGFLNVSYERSIINQISSMTIGLRYNFSFAQTFFSAGKRNHTVVTTQSARGSLVYDHTTNYIAANSQTNVGKGGLIISPFLDLNCNGRRDADEPKAFGLNLRINGGRMEHNTRDTTSRVSGLEAYATYYLELDKTSFDNVAWQIRKPTISVTADPNRFRLIEVPVAVVGEASGKVSFSGSKGITALGRILINIYNSDADRVAQVMTEADGFFDFIGLAPGHYTVGVDPAQLAKLQMRSSPVLSFNISKNVEGDMVNNLEFMLSAIPEGVSPVSSISSN
jgi:hypothetical protein